MTSYKNARYFGGDYQFHLGGFTVEDGRFAEVGPQRPDGVDLRGAYVIPGLVDIHSHGNSGADFSDGDYGGLVKMARYYASSGITSFAPASMTLPEEEIGQAFETAARLAGEAPQGAAVLRGINMEGPFFSPAKKGAQNGAYLRLPDYEFFARLNARSGGLVRIVDVAPELEGAVPFIERAKEDCAVSVAHTAANYEQARAAFEAGASQVTHLFNAMLPLAHREPAVIGAAAEREEVRAELICDGVHIHPSAVRLAFRLFGPERICLISDSMSACGMPDGLYALGGQEVEVKGNRATLRDGTIAGSATNLYDCMVTAISFGIPAEQAVRAASANPADAIAAGGEVGRIQPGLRADFLVCGGDWALQQVHLAGRPLQ